MKFRNCLISLLLMFLAPAALTAQSLPSASPESVGLSSARLERLQTVFKDFVDREQLAGAVVARYVIEAALALIFTLGVMSFMALESICGAASGRV